MNCPPWEMLHADKNRGHLRACSTCRTLADMGTLARPNPDACEELEGLFGLLDDLSAKDSERLSAHLGVCPACTAAYLSLVDDSLAPTSNPNPWKGPSMHEISQPPMIRTRTAMIAGTAFAAAAVLVVLIFVQRDDHEPVVTKPSVVSSQPEHRPAASRPVVMPKPKQPKSTPTVAAPSNQAPAQTSEACDEVTCLVTPNEPCCKAKQAEAQERDAERQVLLEKLERLNREAGKLEEERVSKLEEEDVEDAESLSVRELFESSRSLVRDGRYAKGLAKCEEVLRRAPDHQEGRVVCAIAACHLKKAKKAKRHASKISSAAKRAGIEQICLLQGVKL